MLPPVMNAIGVRGGKGPASALQPVELQTPQAAPGEIVIRVYAAGLNRLDVAQRKGHYPPPPGAPETLGVEVAGEVAAVGSGGSRWNVGDAVCALLGGGGYAEYAAVDGRHALPIPRGVDAVAAAALPEAVFTVFANVFELGRLRSGETFLVHGATSGIGVTAIQMARAAGARVIATARSAVKAEQARGVGADLAIDSSSADFAAIVEAEGGADVILDLVGGDYTPRNLRAARTGGRIVQIAYPAGATVQVDLGLVMVRRLTLTGSTLRARPADEKARLAAAVEAHVWPWIAAGQVRPHVDRTFSLADAAAAHAFFEAGTHLGKVVLTVA